MEQRQGSDGAFRASHNLLQQIHQPLVKVVDSTVVVDVQPIVEIHLYQSLGPSAQYDLQGIFLLTAENFLRFGGQSASGSLKTVL